MEMREHERLKITFFFFLSLENKLLETPAQEATPTIKQN